MNRISFLQQAMEINEVQAHLINELIRDIPNNKLKDFMVFRMKFIEQYKSKELITKEALFEYRKMQVLNSLKSANYFTNIQDMINFIELNFKGKDLTQGAYPYKDYVVLALDDKCNMLNKSVILDNGSFLKLNSEDKALVYNYLYEHQYKIGNFDYVKMITNNKQLPKITKKSQKTSENT